MTSRLKRKLNDLGVDTNSSKANESFCLVCVPGLLQLLDVILMMVVPCTQDWHTTSSAREVQRYGRVRAIMETGGTFDYFQYWAVGGSVSWREENWNFIRCLEDGALRAYGMICECMKN